MAGRVYPPAEARYVIAMTRIARPLASALLVFLILASGAARAEHATPAELTPEDRAALTRIQSYLNDMTTAEAHFTQASDGGEVATGMFYLSRPGKLRFDYAQPKGDIIVADGSAIYYYDAKLKESNHTAISATLADFLLRPEISLGVGGKDSDVTVTDFRQEDGVDHVTLTQTDDPGAGSLTVVLTDKPLQIRQWRVIDQQGRPTEVTLQDPQFGLKLDPKIFRY